MGQTLVLCGDCVSTGHVTCEGEQSRFVTSHGLAFDVKPVNDSLAVVEHRLGKTLSALRVLLSKNPLLTGSGKRVGNSGSRPAIISVFLIYRASSSAGSS